MKKNLLFLLMVFCLYVVQFPQSSYSLEDKSSNDNKEKSSEGSKVILPSSILSSSASPTLSPDISSPQIAHESMTLPAGSTSSVTISNVQSAPATITMPLVEVSEDITKVMDSGNIIGEVLKISSEGEGYILEVRDDDIGKEIKITIDPESTIVAKDNKIVGVKALKISSTVSVVYEKEGEIIKAHFIHILTDRQVKAIEGTEKE